MMEFPFGLSMYVHANALRKSYEVGSVRPVSWKSEIKWSKFFEIFLPEERLEINLKILQNADETVTVLK